MNNIVYCDMRDCPFEDCDRHIKRLEGQEGVRTFVGFGAICRRYITWLVSEVKKDVISEEV